MYDGRVDLAHGNSATFTRRFGINIWFPEYKKHTLLCQGKGSGNLMYSMQTFSLIVAAGLDKSTNSGFMHAHFQLESGAVNNLQSAIRVYT